MISDELVQAALIAKLKTFTDVNAILTGGASNVKELQWQGDQFAYPAERLDLESNEMFYDEQRRCSIQRAEFSVYFFSEERSSKQASVLKGLLINDMMLDGFTQNTIRFMDVRLIDSVTAVREDERTWRTQAKFRVYVF